MRHSFTSFGIRSRRAGAGRTWWGMSSSTAAPSGRKGSPPPIDFFSIRHIAPSTLGALRVPRSSLSPRPPDASLPLILPLFRRPTAVAHFLGRIQSTLRLAAALAPLPSRLYDLLSSALVVSLQWSSLHGGPFGESHQPTRRSVTHIAKAGSDSRIQSPLTSGPTSFPARSSSSQRRWLFRRHLHTRRALRPLQLAWCTPALRLTLLTFSRARF